MKWGMVAIVFLLLVIVGCTPEDEEIATDIPPVIDTREFTCQELCEEKSYAKSRCGGSPVLPNAPSACEFEETQVGSTSDCNSDDLAGATKTCCCRGKLPHQVDGWGTDEAVIDLYAEYIKKADAKISSDDIRCFEQPTTEEIPFNSLQSIKPLRKLYSSCQLTNCHHPACTLSNWLYYFDDEGTPVVFEERENLKELIFEDAENIEDYFSILFSELNTQEEALEYLDFANIPILGPLDEVLSDWEVVQEDCEFSIEAPQVDELITETGKGFMYHGYAIDPELIITLSYAKFQVTADGAITTVDSKVVANCGQGVMF